MTRQPHNVSTTIPFLLTRATSLLNSLTMRILFLHSPMPPLSKFGRSSLPSDYSTKRAKVYQSFFRCGTCSDLATDMQSSMQVTFQQSTSHNPCDDIAIPSPKLSALLSALKVRISHSQIYISQPKLMIHIL